MTRWNSTGHRGDGTENLIDEINKLYKKNNLAIVTKVPVPIKVLKIKKGKITEAFFEKKSTVDYQGVVQGYPICFDVKETNNKSLPLKNIHQHQITYMNSIRNQKGYSFILCHFKSCRKFYLIPIEKINQYWNTMQNGGRKSIPIDDLDEKYLIKSENGLPNYLSALNIYLKSCKYTELKSS